MFSEKVEQNPSIISQIKWIYLLMLIASSRCLTWWLAVKGLFVTLELCNIIVCFYSIQLLYQVYCNLWQIKRVSTIWLQCYL